MSGTNVASGDAINIENITADKVYVANNLYDFHLHVDPSDIPTESQEERVLTSGCDGKSEDGTRANQWTQIEQKKIARICQNFTRVDIRVSKDDNNSVEGGSCQQLARLQWQGGTSDSSDVLSAWKMDIKKEKVEEEMKQLRKEILNSITKETSRKKLCKAIEAIFQHGMKLLGLDCGSIVFIFEHKRQDDMQRVLASLTEQEEIQEKLCNILPEWVARDDIQWTVTRCQAGTDSSMVCELGEPIELFRQQFGSLGMPDYGLLEQMMQKVFKDNLPSLFQNFRKTQDSSIQQLRETIQSLMQQSKTQPMEGTTAGLGDSCETETAVSDVEDATQTTSFSLMEDAELALMEDADVADASQTSLATDHETMNIAEPLSCGVVGDSQSLPHAPHASQTGGNIDEKTISQGQKHIFEIPNSKAGAGPLVHEASHTVENVEGTNLLLGPRLVPDQTAIAAHLRTSHPSFPAQRDLGSESTNPKINHPHHEKAKDHFSKQQSTEEFSPKESRSPPSLDLETHKKTGMWVPDLGEKHLYLSGEDNPSKLDLKSEAHSGSPPSDDEGSSGEKKEDRKKIQPSKTIQAEQLLNWVNVKSKASQSRDPEIQRLMEQVEHSLQDEEQESPRARALDTVLVLDTSDSVVKDHLDQLKTVVHTFIDGIEENVETMNLEENLAVVQMGGRAWVRQHLTNDYNRVRDAVDAMTPDSKKMPTGGRSPLFQALLVCLGAIEGRGGVVNVAGCHRVRPRIVFFTDGRPTDEAMEFGTDTQSNVNEVKYALVQLISEYASKKHKTTPSPIFWVPVGNPDKPFMESLAALSVGKVVEVEQVAELCKFYKVQETIGCVYKMVRKHKDMYDTEQQTLSIVNALAGNLDEADKAIIIEEVKRKQKDPEVETGDPDDYDNVYEDAELVAKGELLPLGTRVQRGLNWKWDNQDTDGPGTVIQHRKKRDGWLHVMWDNGTHNAYRCGDGENYDVKKVEHQPRKLNQSELIEIGVQVKRGEDWTAGDEDGNGVGVVIRKRKDGKVKVRWENGHIGKYKFGRDGKMELTVFQPDLEPQATLQEQPAEDQPPEEEEEGAVGGFDPAEGPPRMIWQWLDHEKKEWRMYKQEIQDKLLQDYSRRRDGSCVITRDNLRRRVLFKTNQEKTLEGRGGMLQVQAKEVTELQYAKLLAEEENR